MMARDNGMPVSNTDVLLLPAPFDVAGAADLLHTRSVKRYGGCDMPFTSGRAAYVKPSRQLPYTVSAGLAAVLPAPAS